MSSPYIFFVCFYDAHYLVCKIFTVSAKHQLAFSEAEWWPPFTLFFSHCFSFGLLNDTVRFIVTTMTFVIPLRECKSKQSSFCCFSTSLVQYQSAHVLRLHSQQSQFCHTACDFCKLQCRLP